MKNYCLLSQPLADNEGYVVKVGEFPELHIDSPPHLRALYGPDYEYFTKGLTCEKKGLGVGAHVYYRRVVENQTKRMFKEILKVATKLKAKPEMIEAIENAIKETQFSKAVDAVKDMLPESLLVGGHNPFKLIHKSLSIGVHAETDETCLELAHDVRLVLTDLAERIKLALNEHNELKEAVASLRKFNKESKQ